MIFAQVIVPPGGARSGTARLLVVNYLGVLEPVIDSVTGKPAIFISVGKAEKVARFLNLCRLKQNGATEP